MPRIRIPALVFAFALALSACPAPAYDYSPETPLPSPDECLRILQEGNARFMQGIRQIHASSTGLRSLLADKGQQPVAAVIACSDSREPVEYIFDQPLGGVFVIRTAGNTAGFQTMGSVQYAVHHLHTPLVIVMGHTACGAVHAAVSGAKEGGALSELLAPLLAIAGRDEMKNSANAQRDVELANVRETMATLLKTDDYLRKNVESGKVKLLGAVYNIETGEVSWLDA